MDNKQAFKMFIVLSIISISAILIYVFVIGGAFSDTTPKILLIITCIFVAGAGKVWLNIKAQQSPEKEQTDSLEYNYSDGVMPRQKEVLKKILFIGVVISIILIIYFVLMSLMSYRFVSTLGIVLIK